jgi:hypothetical protein
MEEVFYRDEKERQQVESFIREKKWDFERQECVNAIDAERRGEPYQEKDFPGVSEQEALSAVRDGWKSKLDLAFERKRKREEARGIRWQNK